MRTTATITASALALSLVSVTAFARDYDQSHLPYSDSPSDRPTAIAISALTASGVLQGDPSGTIRPTSELNRAEFMKIVMSLLSAEDTASWVGQSCFPDVAADAWYAPYVCHAKSIGAVSGHAEVGVDPSLWKFKPNSSVQYEEAVKILVSMYGLSLDGQGGLWYAPYIRAAESHSLALSALRPGDHIKRGEMARLVVGFLAFNENELPKLRNAEQGVSSSSKSSSSSMTSFSSVSSVSSNKSSSSSSTSWKGGYDTRADVTIRSQVVALGSTNAILGSVNLFSNDEPLDVTRVHVTLVDSTSTLDSVLLYDEDRRYLGRASLDASFSGETRYALSLPQGTLVLPKRENVGIYVRADVKSYEEGGRSDEFIEVASFGIQGNGQWSNDDYNQTYDDTFPTFLTARARIARVENAGVTTDNFTVGSDQRIGRFHFVGEGDSQGMNDLRVKALTFQVDAATAVTLSNVYLKRDGGDEHSTCTVSAGIVTCVDVASSIGSVKGDGTINVYADVAASGVNNPTLRLTLNAPGTATVDGSVTWTDGISTFTWIGVDAPIVRGTQFN